MQYVVELYTEGRQTGRFVKSVSPFGFASTSSIKYAKKYKTADLAQGDCDLVAYFTNGLTIGSINPVN